MEHTFNDPVLLDWNQIDLPGSWVDQLSLWNPIDLLFLIRHFLTSTRSEVKIPKTLLGYELIPNYSKQEFHCIPNGNFSKKFSAGYASSFDRMMLGRTVIARKRAIELLEEVESVLDIGCGGGTFASEFLNMGITDVWGIDINPYLLRLAADRYKSVNFLQAQAESTGFEAQRFSTVVAFFLFHELPPSAQDLVLEEAHRILKTNGKIAIVEPCEVHRRANSLRELVRKYGWSSLYFKFLSRFVHEPYVDGWQQRNLPRWFKDHGFTVLHNETNMPFRTVIAQKDC